MFSGEPSLEDAGPIAAAEAPKFEARVLNPYDAKASVSSPPPAHHTTVNFEEEFSLDLVRNAGSEGIDVWFKAEPLAPATAVRGRVLQGGKNARRPICKSNVWAHGGGGLQIGIEVLHAGAWVPVGWVLYGHVQDMLVADGDVIESPARLAKVTGLKDNVACSTGGHLHLGFRNTEGYPCWVREQKIDVDGTVAQLGGARTARTPCD